MKKVFHEDKRCWAGSSQILLALHKDSVIIENFSVLGSEVVQGYFNSNII